MNESTLYKSLSQAISSFWQIKDKQKKSSSDSSNRGAVVGGKQMDGFLDMLREACLNTGVPSTCIYDKHNYIPGYFRSSKDWDFMVISPSGKLLVLVELKSQVGSYGNNFNNRTEEALGTATDLWTAFREKQFSAHNIPWVGYLMLIGYDNKSTMPVKNYEPYFTVRNEFDGASYLERYKILCEKLVTERLYTSTCLIWTRSANDFGNVTESISLENFISSLQGYLIGCRNEFD